MQIKTFRIPFEEIVGPEATELAFGPRDYLVIRSLFALPVAQVRDFADRIGKVGEATTPEEADALVLDLLGLCVVEWHLDGPDGSIPMPATGEDLDALPGAVRSALFPFLAGFRGKPDPTPAA